MERQRLLPRSLAKLTMPSWAQHSLVKGGAISSFIKRFFTEEKKMEGVRVCAETEASFLSQLTMWWMNRLMVAGFRSPLTEDDVDNLHPRQEARNIVPRFLKHWQKKTQPREKKQKHGDGDWFPLIQQNGHVQCDSTNKTEINSFVQGDGCGGFRAQDQEKKVSLLGVLGRTFGMEAFLIQLWQLVHDVFMLTNPLVLGLLVDFIQDETMETWKGFLYAGALFFSLVIQSVCHIRVYHLSGCLGLRVRTAVMSAVFRKALVMDVTSRQESTVGEIVNLMSVDAEHLEHTTTWLYMIWSGPIQILTALCLLYITLGPPMLAGLAVVVMLVPVNSLILRGMRRCEEQMMELKDKRLKILSEVLNGIKILKMYAWEKSFSAKIGSVRDKELHVRYYSALWDTFLHFSWTVAPYIVSLTMFTTYVYTTEDHYLRPKTAFVTLGLLEVLRYAINTAPSILSDVIKAVVSIRRLNRYLNQAEIDTSNVTRYPDIDEGEVLSIQDGTFTWNPELSPTLYGVNLSVTKGSLVAVVGTVGVGKSSLLSALLGEMHKLSGSVTVKGSVAYVPQQAWIQHASLRGNVLFGRTMNQVLYDRCLSACALSPDLAILPGGDMTEIGEKGINLSGGQKQRVSLARAVYSDKDIYLLDDPLSAVDVHVGMHIFENVVGHSGMLAGKTRLLVTHGIQWLPLVDVVVMVKNGHIVETGSYNQLLTHNGPFAQYLKNCLIQVDSEEEEEDPEVHELKMQMMQRLDSIPDERMRLLSNKKCYGGLEGHTEEVTASSRTKEELAENIAEKRHILVEEETVENKRVKWSVFWEFAKAIGMAFFVVIIISFALYHAAFVVCDIFLSRWTDDVELQNFTALPANSSERMDANNYYLKYYGGFGILQAIAMIAYSMVLNLRMISASRAFHSQMLARILCAPMSFFDTTPVGRIVNRFSQDINTIDAELPFSFSGTIESSLLAMSTVVVITYGTLWFLVALVPLVALYILVQVRFYIPASRQLKRLESKSRSPIYSYFSEALVGASVIRAFGVQGRFIDELEDRVDGNSRFRFHNYCANRWLGFRLDFLGALSVLTTAIAAVALRHSMPPGVAGLAITYAMSVTAVLNFFVDSMSNLELHVISIERVQEYMNMAIEAPWHIPKRKPPKSWPGNGEIGVNGLSLRYREGLDLVLKDVTFHVSSGEKVGIVGRTGAGKSSLTLALFRLVELAGGKVHIDYLDTSVLGLHHLRPKLAILPQDPFIFGGSLRMNLDPFSRFTDEEIWAALEHAHLKSFVSSLPDGLEYECGEGGDNLSVGQRQLLCLARTLLHKTRILVLDEATAAVDMETDDLIQQTLRTEFADCSVLTIAHRLHTVMDYDKILVLDKGRVSAFDSPQRLLEDTSSIFYDMVHSAGLVQQSAQRSATPPSE
ncbi:hypothetical protein BaRGS_00027291 [Batillaria attramentaria]|uniref:ABC-type glutathione-S-conjugate transporter n=1 Tax=Batillaria attramentaria TaxID=370345 RepID=A0ABD0K368_9CAEN